MRPPPRGLVPFRIDVPPRVLDDLAERLARARLVDYWREFGVPTAFVACPHGLFPAPPNRWVQRVYVRRTELTVSGHFLAYERPAEFVEGVRAFFRDYPGGRSG